MATIYFEDVDVGDELPVLQMTFDGDAVRHYATVANMAGGRFMSDAEAQAEGLPGQILPGNLSMALLSRLVSEWGEGPRLLRLGCTFRQIVRPGVPLTLHGVITEKHTSDHGSFVECDLLLENADGEHLVTGTATVALPLRATR